MGSNGVGASAAMKASLMAGLSVSLDSGKFSDLTVKLGDKSWKAHKLVVCAVSDFFAKACEGQFKEATAGCIELHDDDSEVIDNMLRFMYTGNYDALNTTMSPLLLHVRMVAAAENYMVEQLAEVAIWKFSSEVVDNWPTPAFVNAVEETYYSTTKQDHPLRALLHDVCVKHAGVLFGDSDEHCGFRDMARRIPEFAADVAAALARRQHTPVYMCPAHGCKTRFTSRIAPGQELEWCCQTCYYGSYLTYDDLQDYRVKDDEPLVMVEADESD